MSETTGRRRAASAAIKGIDIFNSALGEIGAWLTVAMVLICFAIVVMRYVFGAGFVWMQDLYVWMNGIVFTMVAGFAFLKDAHVRVDVFYRPASDRFKAWVDLIGFFVFLLPFVAVVAWVSWPYVAESWQIAESSRNTGGMPAFYVVKTFLLVFCGAVLLQGIAFVLRSILVLTRHVEDVPADVRYDAPHEMLEV